MSESSPRFAHGFSLGRVELLNWGTFGRRVWSIAPGGGNALLTGDIGSGKSTFVDAITTLLVPHHRIVFNKAAGAEGKERSLYSYVRGEYKSEKNDLSHAARAVYLRDEASYSVILAEFSSPAFSAPITLAQVFWLKDNKRNPERFFVVGERPLGIASDFSGFGSNPLDLKRRLRRTAGVEVFDQFKRYAGRFQKLLGLKADRALELFSQTISMKAVDNLTDFVRRHMLEPGLAEERLDALRSHFDDLNRAHEAVLRAKDQVSKLAPLVTDADALAEEARNHEGDVAARDGLTPYMGRIRVIRLEERIAKRKHEIDQVDARIESARNEDNAMRLRLRQVEADLDQRGGAQLRLLDEELERLRRELERRMKRASAYKMLVDQEGLAMPTDVEAFSAVREHASSALTEVEAERRTCETRRTECAVEIAEIRKELGEATAEIASLKERTSNLPRAQLELRAKIAEAVGVAASELPFVGELLRVREEDSEWEGAIERVLRGFGSSVLVPEHLYASVSDF
ncbi:MAG: ATP-binding protein, partial [Myxococcota bacterium]